MIWLRMLFGGHRFQVRNIELANRLGYLKRAITRTLKLERDNLAAPETFHHRHAEEARRIGCRGCDGRTRSGANLNISHRRLLVGIDVLPDHCASQRDQMVTFANRENRSRRQPRYHHRPNRELPSHGHISPFVELLILMRNPTRSYSEKAGVAAQFSASL